jgi:antitoxin CptB
MRVMVVLPCYIDAFFPEVGIATFEPPERFGHEVVYPLTEGVAIKRIKTDITSMSALVSGISGHDDRIVRCRRLLFRCWHRGTQEGDLILGRFAEAYLADLDNTQIGRLEALLDCADPDLFDWIVAGLPPPKEYDHDVMRLLRSFALHDNRKIEDPRTITTTQEQ